MKCLCGKHSTASRAADLPVVQGEFKMFTLGDQEYKKN